MDKGLVEVDFILCHCCIHVLPTVCCNGNVWSSIGLYSGSLSDTLYWGKTVTGGLDQLFLA